MSARNRLAAGGQVIPRKGDLDYPLWLSAIDVAIHAPWKQGKNVWAAQIPWDDIHEMRRVLEALGVDWQEGKRADDDERARIARERQPAVPRQASPRFLQPEEEALVCPVCPATPGEPCEHPLQGGHRQLARPHRERTAAWQTQQAGGAS